MKNLFSWKTRYTVLAIVFTGFTVSFVNRISMSVAIPYVAEDLHLSTPVMGIVLSAFFEGYTVSQIPGGMLADKFGSRKIMTISLIWWSIFTAITGAVVTLGQMLWTRLIFGFGEGLYLGGSTKTVSVWFPRRERAAAMAIKLASNSVGTAYCCSNHGGLGLASRVLFPFIARHNHGAHNLDVC
jgi:sugar phosphate permease